MTNRVREHSECSGGTTKFKQEVLSDLDRVAPQLVVLCVTPESRNAQLGL